MLTEQPSMAINILDLWDFSQPAQSEERFNSLLSNARPNDQLILKTQIARTYGLRKDFKRAREILTDVLLQLTNASAEAVVRFHLEWGRTLCSTAHAPESMTQIAREEARRHYLKAIDLAKRKQLDYLAIDAMHMMTLVDTEPEDQLKWNQEAIAYMEASTQADSMLWEGSLRNNLGYALNLAGRLDEAMEQFELALAAREKQGKTKPIRIAHWMIAWNLFAMGKIDEALSIQHVLEHEYDAEGERDLYVYEQLELLYRAKGDEEKAEFYAQKHRDAW